MTLPPRKLLAARGAAAARPVFGFALNPATACDVFYWLQVPKFDVPKTGIAGLSNLFARPLIEDGAQSFLIESQTESVCFGKFRNVRFSIFCLEWPQTLQFLLVDGAVLQWPAAQFGFNSLREQFHPLYGSPFNIESAPLLLAFTLQKLPRFCWLLLH